MMGINVKAQLSAVNLIVLPPTIPAMLVSMVLRNVESFGPRQIDYLFIRDGKIDMDMLVRYCKRSERSVAWIGHGPIQEVVDILTSDNHSMVAVLEASSRMVWQRAFGRPSLHGLVIEPQDKGGCYTGPGRVLQVAVGSELKGNAKTLCNFAVDLEGATPPELQGIPATIDHVIRRCPDNTPKHIGQLRHCIDWFANHTVPDQNIANLIEVS